MNATHALGWALVHFLWQGAALALLLLVGLAVTRNAAAQTRYTLSLVTLAAMLVVPLATGIALYDPRGSVTPALIAGAPAVPEPSRPVAPARSPSPSPSPSPSVSRSTNGTDVAAAPLATADRVAALRELLTPVLPWLVMVWVLGVVVLSVRLAHVWFVPAVISLMLVTIVTAPGDSSVETDARPS